MTRGDWLVERFQETRGHLRKVAYRMLGSGNEADDAVQEAWLRVSDADTSAVGNLGGWMTTVVARVCLDMLRSRSARREDALGVPGPDEVAAGGGSIDAETDLLLADSVGPALLVVLETLGPAERVAFVLHDMFDLSFDEVAVVLGRSPEAARQLASRARRRVRGEAATPGADLGRQRHIVDAFLAASRDGDFNALVALLHPDVRLRADEAAVRTAAATKWGGSSELPGEVHGARPVAETLKGRARGVHAALLNGVPGAAFAMGGQVRAAWVFAFTGGKIAGIDLVMDPDRLATLEVDVEETEGGKDE
jgi:RNA polymerase sigma factor (sigma-70 family)